MPFNFSDDFPVQNTLEGDRMLRFLFVFSATPFWIYNPDNGKTRVVYQIGLVSHPNSGSPTWKVYTLLAPAARDVTIIMYIYTQ